MRHFIYSILRDQREQVAFMRYCEAGFSKAKSHDLPIHCDAGRSLLHLTIEAGRVMARRSIARIVSRAQRNIGFGLKQPFSACWLNA